MRNLLELRLFPLLENASKGKRVLTELKEAYEEFAITLLDQLQIETNMIELYYHLGFVRLELAGFRDTLSDGQEKKCFKSYN